jgi:hypothetical protein
MAYTATVAGLYRVTGAIYGTTASSSAYSVELALQWQPLGMPSSTSAALVSDAIGTSIANPSNGQAQGQLIPLGIGGVLNIGTYTVSGTNTGGVWSYAWTVERVK